MISILLMRFFRYFPFLIIKFINDLSAGRWFWWAWARSLLPTPKMWAGTACPGTVLKCHEVPRDLWEHLRQQYIIEMGQSTIALTKLLNSDEKQSLSITHIIQFSEMFQIIRIFPAENERSHRQTAVPLRLVRRLRCLRPLWWRGEPGRAAAGGGRGGPRRMPWKICRCPRMPGAIPTCRRWGIFGDGAGGGWERRPDWPFFFWLTFWEKFWGYSFKHRQGGSFVGACSDIGFFPNSRMLWGLQP